MSWLGDQHKKTVLDEVTTDHLREAIRLALLADTAHLAPLKIAVARIGYRLIEFGEQAFWDDMQRLGLLPGDVVSKNEARLLLELEADNAKSKCRKRD